MEVEVQNIKILFRRCEQSSEPGTGGQAKAGVAPLGGRLRVRVRMFVYCGAHEASSLTPAPLPICFRPQSVRFRPAAVSVLAGPDARLCDRLY